jgi:hypothetical protein
MTKPLSDKEVISRLGGPSALAKELPYSEHAIAGWMKSDRGIPWKARAQVREAAKKRRLRLPSDFLALRRPPEDEVRQQDAA